MNSWELTRRSKKKDLATKCENLEGLGAPVISQYQVFVGKILRNKIKHKFRNYWALDQRLPNL